MDDHEEGSQRKRPRLDDSDANSDCGDKETSIAVKGPPIVRDELYYRMDGDCVILVGNVLFKVHRFLLERDSSAFANMFSMPQGDSSPAQSLTDENPLVLHDDIEDFRALCWIIYALPPVYQKQHSEFSADIEKLVPLFMIVHKYHFESHEKWAQGLLQRHCRRLKAPPVQRYFLSCPSSRLENLFRLSTNKDGFGFQQSVRTVWLYRLKQNAEESIIKALAVAEELGDREFQAEIYYNELMRMEGLSLPNSTGCICPASGLAPHQELALYRGYWSLQTYWNHTLKASLSKKFTCPTTHGCNQEWQRIWCEYFTKGIMELRFDPIKSLSDMASDLGTMDSDEDDEYISCAWHHITRMNGLLRRTLSDHFLGPPLAS